MQQLKPLIVLAILSAASIVACAQSRSAAPMKGFKIQPPKIGEAAPAMELEKLLQAPSGAVADLEKLKGKVVVLEFWATWCSPCIPAITHLNEMADKFKDKPVQFVAITDEDETKITEFLKIKPIRGWVGLDLDRSMFNSYQAIGVPHTVLVDQNGKIAAVTSARHVTAAALDDLLAGKPVALPFKEGIAADLKWDKAAAADQVEPLFQVIIKPSNATTGGIFPQPGRITADGISLLAAVIAAHKTSYYRIVSNLPQSSENYKISVVAPKGREELLHPIFQQALAAAFDIRVRREKREMDVFVLAAPEGKTTSPVRPSQAKKPFAMFMRGQMRAEKQPLETLANHLESLLERPIVNETSLKEEYDWELPYSHVDMNILVTAVRERLGLELIKAKRPIDSKVTGSR